MALLVFLGVGALTLGGLAVWQTTRSDQPGSGSGAGSSGFKVTVTSASASRDDRDFPVVAVAAVVEIGPNALDVIGPFTPSVQCGMRQKQSSTGFSSQIVAMPESAVGQSSVQATITPGAAGQEIQGTYDVTCTLIRNGSALTTSAPVTVNVPGPSTAEPLLLAGDYGITLEPELGDPCDYEYPPMHVDQSDQSAVAFSFPTVTGGTTFPVGLGSDLSFNFAGGSLGVFNGRFVVNEFGVLVEGSVERTTPTGGTCNFTLTGQQRLPAPDD